MSGFSFNETAGASQSTNRLEGNKIHTVKLTSVETEDIKGVKHPDEVYKVIKINFESDGAMFQHTVFEPKPDDFDRKYNEFTDKTGKTNKIPQPTGVENMMLLLKHIIDAFVPEVGAKIDSKEKQLTAPDWESLRKLVVKILTIGVGRESKIKLVKNKRGDAIFPGFFASMSRDGQAYIRNNFVGEKVAFTPYEMKRIQDESTSKPTNMSSAPSLDDAGDIDLDLDIDTEEL